MHHKRGLSPSENVPGDTRRGRGADAVPLSPAQEVGSTRMQRWSVRWHGQALEQGSPWAGSGAARSLKEHPQHCKKQQRLQLRVIQRAPGKISFLGKIPAKLCGSDSTPRRFCTCRITPAWRSHSFGACVVPPEIPAGKLLQENCQRVWAEPKTMGLVWEWLWFLQP